MPGYLLTTRGGEVVGQVFALSLRCCSLELPGAHRSPLKLLWARHGGLGAFRRCKSNSFCAR
jgi:hypothetical protein